MAATRPTTADGFRGRLLVGMVALALLVGCAAPGMQLTYVDVQATAVTTVCWPGNYPTPNPVVVTPYGPTPTPGGMRIPLTTIKP